MLNDKSLQELKEILEEEYNVNINSSDLYLIGKNLLDYFEILAEIHSEKK